MNLQALRRAAPLGGDMSTPMQSNLDIPEVHTPELSINVGERIASQQPGTADLIGASDDLMSHNSDDSEIGRRLPRNVGPTEQKIRMSTGLGLLVAAPFVPLNRNWKIAMAAVGAMELITGYTQYCPLWHSLGVSTNESGER